MLIAVVAVAMVVVTLIDWTLLAVVLRETQVNVINKGIINTIKGNDNNIYNSCHVGSIMRYILWQEATFLSHLQPN